jgi:hypothetical protein
MSKAEGEEDFKARVVSLILDSKTEQAIELLSKHYGVEKPKISVGVFAGRTKGVRAVYNPRSKEILASSREYFSDPFTVLHEFYHHLRTFSGKHRGTEKHANIFAIEFIKSYKKKVEGKENG